MAKTPRRDPFKNRALRYSSWGGIEPAHVGVAYYQAPPGGSTVSAATIAPRTS